MGNVYKLKEEEKEINGNENIVLVYEYEDYYDWINVYHKYDDKCILVGTLNTSSTLYREYYEYRDNKIVLVRVPVEDGTKYIKALYDTVNKEFIIDYNESGLYLYDEAFKPKTK